MRNFPSTISNFASSRPLPLSATVLLPSSASEALTVAAIAFVEFSAMDVRLDTVMTGLSSAPLIVKLKLWAPVVLVPSDTLTEKVSVLLSLASKALTAEELLFSV